MFQSKCCHHQIRLLGVCVLPGPGKVSVLLAKFENSKKSIKSLQLGSLVKTIICIIWSFCKCSVKKYVIWDILHVLLPIAVKSVWNGLSFNQVLVPLARVSVACAACQCQGKLDIFHLFCLLLFWMQQTYRDSFYFIWATKSHPISVTHGQYWTDSKSILRVPWHLQFREQLKHIAIRRRNTEDRPNSSNHSDLKWLPNLPALEVCYDIQVTGFFCRLWTKTWLQPPDTLKLLWEVLFRNAVHLCILSTNALGWENSNHHFLQKFVQNPEFVESSHYFMKYFCILLLSDIHRLCCPLRVCLQHYKMFTFMLSIVQCARIQPKSHSPWTHIHYFIVCKIWKDLLNYQM